MSLDELCRVLLDALKNYDHAILPLGLYASDELVPGKNIKPRQMEWKNAIVPAILSAGGGTSKGIATPGYNYFNAGLVLPELGEVDLKVLRYSKIKVRKFGSGYQVDKHEDRSQRWERTDLSGHISALWKQPDADSRAAKILVFIGFDQTPDPLRRELNGLLEDLNWDAKNVSYFTRAWQDKAERGFGVRLCAWARVFPN